MSSRKVVYVKMNFINDAKLPILNDNLVLSAYRSYILKHDITSIKVYTNKSH